MKLLDALREESYEVAVGPLVTTPVLRRRLAQMPDVGAIRNALQSQLVDDAAIKAFVEELLKDFRPGERFSYDIALASLCVVLEDRPTAMAAEFLESLASLQLQELPTSIRVARESLARHRLLPKTTRQEISISVPSPQFDFRVLSKPRGGPPTPIDEMRW